MDQVNFIAVLVAAVSTFLLGGLWYSKVLFGPALAASFDINYQFANRSTVLWLIDGGYHAAQFTIYGLILGLWR